MKNKLIAVTIGDINGVGIEILLNLWLKNQVKNFIIFTNLKIFKQYYSKKNYKFKFKAIKDINFLSNIKESDKLLYIYDYKTKNKYTNTYDSIIKAHQFTKLKKFIGIITLPLNKELIIDRVDKKFVGQTELFQKLDNKKISNMMFVNKKNIITTLTNHIPIRDVSKKLKNQKLIYTKIVNLYETLKKDFKIKDPKIAISGINPHAGENGKIGNEEIKYLKPVIEKLKKNNIILDGPLSADSLFIKSNLNYYNCFITAYHDQALIAFKILSNFSGLNYTSGIDTIRVSPDHGTAYNLIGTNKINFLSILACFKFVHKIELNRNKL